MSDLAVDAAGNRLLSFRAGVGGVPDDLDAAVPLPLALIVATSTAGVLLVHDRWRRSWELPGGMIEPGESPREAAARELLEETGRSAGVLVYAGLATFQLQPDERVERGAGPARGLGRGDRPAGHRRGRRAVTIAGQSGERLRPDPVFDVTAVDGVDAIVLCRYLRGDADRPGADP